MRVLKTELPLKFLPVLLDISVTVQPSDFCGPIKITFAYLRSSYELKIGDFSANN